MRAIPRKILFVDDDELQIKLMKRTCVKMGYDCAFAKSAKEALEILDNEEYPIIITDLRMPEMNGIELCKRIREKRSEAIIYAFSGLAEVESDYLEDIGFDGLLCKPVTLKVLERAIDGAFEKIDKRE